MARIRVGIIGDHNPELPSHRATEAALRHAADQLGISVVATWLPTAELERDAAAGVAGFDALWCAPGSPYRSMPGALAAIRAARTADRPFLGTCGGCQHVVLEYARHVLGIADAQHGEYAPDAAHLFITPLSCSLVGRTMRVAITPGSHTFQAYGRGSADERYHCNFGLNPAYRAQLEEGGLRVVGVDQDQEARIVELPALRFFIATLFVPQVTSTPAQPHPLILAYLDAARQAQLDTLA
jgi:CTP synthase (UTP-ammonia lyase)